MKQQHPDFQFLNTNPNPTLGDLLAQFDAVKNTTSNFQNPIVLVDDLKKDISKLSIAKGIIDLIEQLKQQIEEEDFSGASDKIKNGLKRIKRLQEHNHIQQKIEVLYNSIKKAVEHSYEETAHEKALFLLSQLAYLDSSICTPLSEIKNKLSPEAFTLYIAFQTIGCVQGDGWAFGVFGNMPQLVPYLPNEFEKLGYRKTAQAIQNTINAFPENTNFLFDNQDYIDVLNFIENPRRKVDNPKLNKYTKEERQQYCKNYHHALQQIEAVEDELWNGINEPDNLVKYYNDNLEKHLWKTV